MIEPVERVVLLGYMCSGKSTVGAALARRLEWDLVDFDAEIEHRTGQPVKALVSAGGDAALRTLEAELTAALAGRTRVVLAPGGGWIEQPGLLAALGPGTLSVWLSAAPGEILRRLRDSSEPRPLRDHPDPLTVIARMTAEREPLYALAHAVVRTDGLTPEAVAYRIERMVRGD